MPMCRDMEIGAALFTTTSSETKQRRYAAFCYMIAACRIMLQHGLLCRGPAVRALLRTRAARQVAAGRRDRPVLGRANLSGRAARAAGVARAQRESDPDRAPARRHARHGSAAARRARRRLLERRGGVVEAAAGSLSRVTRMRHHCDTEIRCACLRSDEES